MATGRDLIQLSHEVLRGEIQRIPALSSLVESGPSETLENLLSRVQNPSFPQEGKKYLFALIVIKAQSTSPLTIELATKVVICYLELCKILPADPNEMFGSLRSALTVPIMSCDDMEMFFEWGKIMMFLKSQNIEVTELENILDISYSSLIFDCALNSSKEGNMYALKCLVKAARLNMDSTGGQQAIISNSLSWIENNNDFYGVNAQFSIAMDKDDKATKDINGMLELVNIDDESTIQRRRILLERYGSNTILVKYPEDSLEEEKSYKEKNMNFEENASQDEIKSLDEIEIDNDPLKSTNNSEKTIYTYLYKARIKKNNNWIAVKKIRATNENDLEKYNLEIKIMRELSVKKNCFLRFYGGFKVKNELFLLMEFVEDSLIERLEKGANFTEIQQVQIARLLIEGFSFMSHKRIYHRDIKPHNILITQENVPKIIDFGITIFSQGQNVSTTISGKGKHIQGTPGYMSPEQRKACDAYKADKTQPILEYNFLKSDVYSLGLTFLQLCTGANVSEYELEANNADLISKVRGMQNSKLKPVILKMVKLKPSERADFNELLADFGGQTVTVVT